MHFWKDKKGNLAIWQTPNIPLILWFVSMVLAQLLQNGHVKSGILFISGAALFTWAYLEITDGESYFRRLLGILVLMGLLIPHFR